MYIYLYQKTIKSDVYESTLLEIGGVKIDFRRIAKPNIREPSDYLGVRLGIKTSTQQEIENRTSKGSFFI